MHQVRNMADIWCLCRSPTPRRSLCDEDSIRHARSKDELVVSNVNNNSTLEPYPLGLSQGNHGRNHSCNAGGINQPDIMRDTLRVKNQSITERFLNSGGISGNTVLHRACRENNPLKIQKLLEFKAYINAVNVRKETPLHVAAQFNHTECVKVLLGFGCKEVDKDMIDGAGGAGSGDIDETHIDELDSDLARTGGLVQRKRCGDRGTGTDGLESYLSLGRSPSNMQIIDFRLRSRVGNFAWQEGDNDGLRNLIFLHAKRNDPRSVDSTALKMLN